MKQVKFDFTGQTAIVTGAGQGIGAGASRSFAEAGANVVLADISEERIRNVQSELEALPGVGRILPIRTDVTSLEDIHNMVERTAEEFGAIDILFNNAGISRYHPVEDFPYEDWRAVMSVNLDGVFFVAQAVARKMIERRKGKIINTASTSAFIVNVSRQNAAYCVAKAGLVMMTKVMAINWAKYNIEVNAVAPAYTRTPLIQPVLDDPERRKAIEARSPKKRVAETDEIVAAVLFLASDASSFISGDCLKVDAGYSVGW